MNIKSFPHVLLFPLLLSVSFNQFAAADEGGMSEEQMQQMAEPMQKMLACMANVDQSNMEKLAARAEAVGKEIKTLCDAGKRDQALQRAKDYGSEMAKSKEMEEMMKCGAMAKQMIGQMGSKMQELGPKICDQ